MHQHNFNSGPAVLPESVLSAAAAAIYDFDGTGLSLLEIGHRTPKFQAVLEEAIAHVKTLMQLNDDYAILFLHGGATTQFMQVPMNLLDEKATAAYCVNGIWGSKAAKEAALFGQVIIAADSSDQQHRYINESPQVSGDAVYLHITTNNTVEGTQWHQYPDTNVPLVADMSSDIFSRNINFSKFALIYAGAQKNMGAAGVNMVVVRKDMLDQVSRKIPTIMDYRQHIAAGSLMNTPPVFALYVSMLTLRWIVAEGGLTVMEQRNNAKQHLLYKTIDELPVFKTYITPPNRSWMNAVFFIEDASREQEFLDLCKREGMVGIKGYRTMGGFRVSMYNALPHSSVEAICSLMHFFANSKG